MNGIRIKDLSCVIQNTNYSVKTFRALIVDDVRTPITLAHDLKEYCPQIEVVGEADGVKSALEKSVYSNPKLSFWILRWVMAPASICLRKSRIFPFKLFLQQGLIRMELKRSVQCTGLSSQADRSR